MAVETVTFVIKSDDSIPELLDDVVIRIFGPDGTLVTTAVTGEDVDGMVEVELEGSVLGTEYQLRFFRAGLRIRNKRILVYSPAMLPNEFLIFGTTFSLMPALDPKMCRVQGYLRNPTGYPRRGVDVTFIPRWNAFVDGVSTVLTGRFAVRTDAAGFLAVDLFRFGIYDVTIEGPEVVQRTVETPDRDSMLLSYLLFPVVVAVTWDQPTPFALAVGQVQGLVPRVATSDFRDLGLGYEDVQYTVADPSVASVQQLGDRIVLRGNAAGTTTLRVRRADNSIVYLPNLGIDGGDVSVTVA